MISESTIEEVKDKANLVELIGEVVALRRTGSNYSGLCPFHSEKSPSFHIRDGGKYYHCFGCGASGNAITFYMQTKGTSFPQAIEELAQRYGITIKTVGSGKRDVKKEDDKAIYFKANRLAMQFFQESLKRAPEPVKTYVKSRALTAEALQAYAIGFAPLHWSALCDFLRKHGILDEVIYSTGLARRNAKGELYDALRGRLIFPICSDNRKVAGFGGRLINSILEEEQARSSPKYINSPESPIYQKNKTLFGLPQAMTAIRNHGFAYIVEGYMDVVGLWQVGVQNVLATCGTALTENHVRRLSYLCKRVRILFDGDSAGKNAASKSFLTFMNSGLDAKILFLENSEDPDNLAMRLREQTSQYLQNLQGRSLLDCYIDAIVSRYSAHSVKELGAALKGQVCEEVAQVLNKVKNPVEREELCRQAAFKLMIEFSVMQDLLKGVPAKVGVATTIENEKKPEPEQNPDSVKIAKPIPQLPTLDRDILLAVMAKKEHLAVEVLKDAELCLLLDPSSRCFIEGLAPIVSDASISEDQKKESIKALLRDFGLSWVKHWKQAHDMDKNPDVDLLKAFHDCRLQAKKIKLNQSLTQIADLIAQSSDENHKLLLVQQHVMLQKQLGTL